MTTDKFAVYLRSIEKKMHTVYLSLGSNLGDSLKNLSAALHLLSARAGKINRVSPVYKTKAWGKTDQPDFLNIAAEISTALSAEGLMQAILQAEHELGRERAEKWGPRVIDIDILFYENKIIDEPGLHLPHPGIADRRFVLAPLADIAPEFIHPVFKKTIRELLEICPDNSAVTKEESVRP